MDNHTFVCNVVAAVYERYDMEKVDNVYIHADGGKWIKASGDLMLNAIFVMDGFHLEKYIKKLFKLPIASAYAGVICKALYNNNPEAFKKYCKSINKKQDGIRKKKFSEIYKYFRNN